MNPGGGTRPDSVEIIPISGIPVVKPGDDLAALIHSACQAQGLALEEGALVICQKVISKAEGRIVDLTQVTPGPEATRIAEEDGKDARQVEVVLGESTRIVRRGHGVLICETRHGLVCANAGVDLSNAPGEDMAVLLPEDSDASARKLKQELADLGHHKLAIVVSDTFGRPWRNGLVDVAIGSAGLAPIDDARGGVDMEGRELQVTTMATVDQLAAAAGLLMLKNSAIPAVFVRGVPIQGEGSLRELLRDSSEDLFR
ncbi:MAG: coenzyme F420-0:L-glutamate ligase [Myxococcota bacterium]|nr:coenzyme F420-0:L-glutamate ligase [Myxococcota bacterium]